MSGPMVPLGFTREQLVECAERELRLREQHYPRWVGAGKLTASKALEETSRMRAIVEVLRHLPGPAPVPPAQGTLTFAGDGGRKA